MARGPVNLVNSPGRISCISVSTAWNPESELVTMVSSSPPNSSFRLPSITSSAFENAEGDRRNVSVLTITLGAFDPYFRSWRRKRHTRMVDILRSRIMGNNRLRCTERLTHFPLDHQFRRWLAMERNARRGESLPFPRQKQDTYTNILKLTSSVQLLPRNSIV